MLKNSHLFVGPSKFVNGQFSVITKKIYKKNNLLFNIRGPILKNRTKFSFPIDLNRHIDHLLKNKEMGFGCYVNHSCDPNAFIKIIDRDHKKPYIKVIARRNIKKGEEIAVDYASFEYETTIEGLQCNCDQKICRKKISGFKNLSYKIKEKYKKEGIVPDYLIELEIKKNNKF